MSEIIRFISPEQLIDNVTITASTDHDVLKKCIYTAQETKIQSLLGSKLYRALKLEAKNEIQASPNPLAGKRKELIDDFITPALYQWAYHECTLHLNLRSTDKGVLVQSDLNAQQASASQANALRADIRNKGEFYNNLAIEFICTNSSDFPEYTQDDTDKGGVRSGRSGFSSIVYKSRPKKHHR